MSSSSIALVRNPFKPEERLNLEGDYAGISIGKIVYTAAPTTPCRVILNGTCMEAGTWEFYLLKEGDSLIVVSDVGVVAAAIAGVVKAVAGAWGAIGAAGGFAGSAVWGALGKFIVSTAAGMLINMLFPPDVMSYSNTTGNTYSWNPVMTQEQGLSIGAVYGTVDVRGGNVISAYRNLTAEDPELNVLTSYGRGPIHGITYIKVNEQLRLEDDGITTDVRLGYLDQTPTSGFVEAKVETPIGVELLKDAGMYQYDIADGAEQIEVDVTFPNGIYHVKDNGHIRSVVADITVTVYDITAGTSFSISPLITKTENQASPAAYIFGELLSSTTYRWKSKASRSGYLYWSSRDEPPTPEMYDYIDPAHPNATWIHVGKGAVKSYVTGWQAMGNFSFPKNKDYRARTLTTRLIPSHKYVLTAERHNEEPSNGTSRSYLAAIRYVAESAFTYPRTVLLAVTGVASAKYSTSMQITPRIEGKLINVFNGTNWAVLFNTNPAWVCYDILTQPIYDNNLNILRYDGMNPDRVNTNDFYDWACECDKLVPSILGNGTEKLFSFNGVFEVAKSMWDTANEVASNFRGTLYYTGADVRCSVYKKVDTPEQIFTEANIIAGSFSEQFLPWEGRVTEIDITYLDQDNSYNSSTLSVIDSRLTVAKNKLTINARGTTTAAQAWRIGKFALANNRVTHRTIEFDCAIDALDCTIGSVIAFQHRLPEWGFSGRVASIVDNETLEGSGFTGVAVYEACGFTRAEVEAFDYDTRESRVANVPITLQHRNATGEYNSYTVHHIEIAYGNTLYHLIPGTYFNNALSVSDVYAISISTYNKTREFRIASIKQQEDYIFTVSAIEYYSEIFDDVDFVVPEVTLPEIVINEPYPPVTNIEITDLVYLGEGNIKYRDLYTSWTIPSDTNYSHVKLFYRVVDPDGGYGEVLYAGEFTGNNATIHKVPESNKYEIGYMTVNIYGFEAPIGLIPIVPYTVASSLDIHNPMIDDGVSGLRLVNATVEGGDVYSQKDAHFAWDGPSGNGFSAVFGDEFSQIDWVSEGWLSCYEVGIYNEITEQWLLVEETAVPFYDFTLAKNQTIGPVRSFTFAVRVRTVEGVTGTIVTLPVTNPQAPLVENLTVESVTNGGIVRWDRSTDPSCAGYEIHSSTVEDFTPVTNTRVITITHDTLSSFLQLTAGVHYIKIGAFDVFGPEGMVFTEAVAVDVRVLTIADLTADDLFSPPEKAVYKAMLDGLIAEWDEIIPLATEFNLLDNPIYVNALATGIALLDYILPFFEDMSISEPIDREEFASTWEAYMAARQRLNNLLNEYASQRADWSNIVDDDGNRPEDGATVGATPEQVVMLETVIQAVADIADDAILSAVEKQTHGHNWDAIASQYAALIAEAERKNINHGIHTDDYGILVTYMTPLMANREIDSPIDREEFEEKWNNYFTSRLNLEIAIAASIASDIETAQDVIEGLISDDILSATEKQANWPNWEAAIEQYFVMVEDATALGVSYSEYTSTAGILYAYMQPMMDLPEEDSPISRTEFRLKWANYYIELAKLQNALAKAASLTSSWSGVVDDDGLRPADGADVTDYTDTQIANSVVTLDWLGAGDLATQDTIGAGDIEANAVTANEIAAGAVGASEIATGAVGTGEIATNAITANEIASGAVGTSEIANGSIGTTELANDAVTATKIASGAITGVALDSSLNIETDGYITAQGNYNTSLVLPYHGNSYTAYSSIYGVNPNVPTAASGLQAGITGRAINASSVGLAIGTFGVATHHSAGYGVLGYGSHIGICGVVSASTGIGAQLIGNGYGCISESRNTSEFDYYANGSGLYGPFTGAHDGIIADTEVYDIGDIIADIGVVTKRNITNTLCEQRVTTSAKDKGVCGVITRAVKLKTIGIEHDGVVIEAGTTEALITQLREADTYDEFLRIVREPNMPAALNDRIEDVPTSENFTSYRDLLCSILATHKCSRFAALGEGCINVCPEGGDIEIGDYICSSNTAGKGMKQDDDLLHNYTVAKAREAVVWTAEETLTNAYKLVACTYHCG